jgi:hypothetical protein
MGDCLNVLGRCRSSAAVLAEAGEASDRPQAEQVSELLRAWVVQVWVEALRIGLVIWNRLGSIEVSTAVLEQERGVTPNGRSQDKS